MGSFEVLCRLEAVFYCLGLGLGSYYLGLDFSLGIYCLGLGLGLGGTVFVSRHPDIKTISGKS